MRDILSSLFNFFSYLFNKSRYPNAIFTSKKEVFILTSKILGSGHYTAATNLYEAIKQCFPEKSVELYNWDFLAGKAYEFLIQNIPIVWSIFKETTNQDLFFQIGKLHYSVNQLNQLTKDSLSQSELRHRLRYMLFDIESFIKLNKLSAELDLFRQNQPNWSEYQKIIITLPGAQFLGYSRVYNDKTYVLVTDYGKVYRDWALYSPKYFFVPSKFTEDYLRSLVSAKSKIICTGIPVSPLTRELSQISKLDLRNKLGIRSQYFYILAGGGAGSNQIRNMFKQILQLNLENVEFLVVCGRNQSLFKYLKKKLSQTKNPRIRVIDYVDNHKLLELYRAADMVITKPGGITTTELINLHVPIGVYYYLPHEEGNLEHIKYNRLGIINLDPKDFLSELLHLNEEDFAYFSKKMAKLARYDSAEIILDHVFE